MDLEYKEYRPRKIVNVHRHVDGPWFWGKYSAHPYVGCRSGCEFCYLRGGRYLGRRDPNTFDTLIQVKTNAPDLMRTELSGLERDVIACGDWQQPAESRYRLSRRMLQVLIDLEFPLFVVERSPLLTRDIDLLTDINTRSWVGVVYSLSNVDDKLKRAFEPRSPGVNRRLKAIEAIAAAGILVGASLMPVIPFVGDDDAHLENTVRAIREHGGSFVLAGGLTMDGVQAERTFSAARHFDKALEIRMRSMYQVLPDGKMSYSPKRDYAARLGLKVRDLCAKHGLLDRMPRFIPPGPMATNKRIAEKLFLKTYDLELEEAGEYHVWAYRRAAWTIDEMNADVASIFRDRGEAGLKGLPNIGDRLAAEISKWLKEDGESSAPAISH